jgi:pyruvyl transferase EpsO
MISVEMNNAESNSWKINFDNLKDQHKKIADRIGKKSVAYLDLPMHFNIGDLLIYKGTESFFKEYNINVVYRQGISKYINKRALIKADIILFHGGGNFGDIYDVHQQFRESIISKFPEKEIIILPQSVKFYQSINLERAKSIFKSHSNVTIYVRDEESYKIAKLLSDNVYLSPDMAHSLHPIKLCVEINSLKQKNSHRILNMVRNDIEFNPGASNGIYKKKFDWDNLITLNDKLILKLILFLHKIPLISDFSIKIFESFSDELIFKSENYIDSFDIVYTDRLHGFILSALLGKTIKLSDNNYGKNFDYRKAWLTNYPFFIE